LVLKKELNKGPGPIGIFDSGYGGLTILKEIHKQLPQYDYLYLGDNARAPYGTRSFETVYQYTLECVNHLFDKGCHLVVLACNTASAKALRNIQQKDLPNIDPNRRVLGVIRPTTELAGELTKTKHIGVLATTGTVSSQSYPIEINKFHPEVKVFQEACPMWVPLIENNEFNNEGSNYFIEKNVKGLLKQSDKIDTIILGCTHFPLLENKLRQYLPQNVQLVAQGDIVAKGLKDYLVRHPEIESKCTKNGTLEFYTTETPENFSQQAGKFFGKEINAKHLAL
jgi:glutamate racemase